MTLHPTRVQIIDAAAEGVYNVVRDLRGRLITESS